MTARRVLPLLLLAGARLLQAQSDGVISGRVRESWGRGVGIGGAQVEVVGTPLSTVTDYKGRYRLAQVPAGWHSVRVVTSGYVDAHADSLPVYSGTETGQDFFLPRDSMGAPARVPAAVVDPRSSSLRVRFTDYDLASLPISSVGDATALWSGVIGSSYRGGRPGAQAMLIDGIPVRDAYSGTTTPLGLRLLPEFVQEATLSPEPIVTGTASALTGSVSLLTKEGTDRWTGGVRYASDRAFSGAADLGFDRVVGTAGGPLGSTVRLLAALGATGSLQADPHGAPAGFAGTPDPWALSHNGAESIDGAVKMTLHLSPSQTLRILGVHSLEQRLLFDPTFKFDPSAGSGSRIAATLVAATLHRITTSLGWTVGLSYFDRDYLLGEVAAPVAYGFGGLGGAYQFRGREIARQMDTAAARSPIPGYVTPEFAEQTPWGVPAFFLQHGSRGALEWSAYREMRFHVAMTTTRSRFTTVTADAGVAVGRARGFQRVLAWLPVGGAVPPATAASANPTSLTAGVRVDKSLGRSVLVMGLRLEGVRPGGLGDGVRVGVSPQLELQLPIAGSTFTASLARSVQFPDLQYVANIAFDDSLAPGSFRRGNPDLGYESALSPEISIAMHPWSHGSARLTGYLRRFQGLASTATIGTPDSARVTNIGDYTAAGGEVVVDDAFPHGMRVSAAYSLSVADPRSANGFRSTPSNSSASRVLHHLVVTGGGTLPAAVGLVGVLQVQSGAPFGDLPVADQATHFTVDALLRRSVRLGGGRGWVYVDVRNLLDRRNGAARADAAAIEALAQQAYATSPNPIPYDSPRYRAFADLDHNGLVEGAAELLPMYRLAAGDFSIPILSYGTPRTVRLGAALEF
jgi:hypothetical protein